MPGYNHYSSCTCGWCRGSKSSPRSINRPTINSLRYEISNQFTFDSFVNPNARCPECGAAVFFYQSPYGGRVFFDELGPPWPKHFCTDRSNFSSTNQSLSGGSGYNTNSGGLYQWQSEHWEPFIFTQVNDFSRNIIELKGFFGSERRRFLTLYVERTRIFLGDFPLLMKPVSGQLTHIEISSFSINANQNIEIDPVIQMAFTNVLDLARYIAQTRDLAHAYRVIASGKSKNKVAKKKQHHDSVNKKMNQNQPETEFSIAWQKAVDDLLK